MFVRDETHWLFKLSPDEWIRAATAEVRRAERAYASRDARGGLAFARRAGGMALNAVLIVLPNERWGRSYVDHLRGLEADEGAPARVREGCRLLLDTPMSGGGGLVVLRTTRTVDHVLEAARDIVAHAYALVARHTAS